MYKLRNFDRVVNGFVVYLCLRRCGLDVHSNQISFQNFCATFSICLEKRTFLNLTALLRQLEYFWRLFWWSWAVIFSLHVVALKVSVSMSWLVEAYRKLNIWVIDLSVSVSAKTSTDYSWILGNGIVSRLIIIRKSIELK